jgi:hypothetical protein
LRLCRGKGTEQKTHAGEAHRGLRRGSGAGKFPPHKGIMRRTAGMS